MESVPVVVVVIVVVVVVVVKNVPPHFLPRQNPRITARLEEYSE